MRHTVMLALLTAATLVAGTARPSARVQVTDAPLRITAFAVNMSNVGRGGTNNVDTEVDCWSTDAEREQLAGAFDGRPTGC